MGGAGRGEVKKEREGRFFSLCFFVVVFFRFFFFLPLFVFTCCIVYVSFSAVFAFSRR